MKKRYLVIFVSILLIIIGLFLNEIGPFFMPMKKKKDEVVSGSILVVNEIFCKDSKWKYICKYDGKKYYCVSNKRFCVGDSINGEFLIKFPSYARNRGGFDYRKVLRSKGVFGDIKINVIKKVDKGRNPYYWYCEKFVVLREKMNKFFFNFLNKDVASVIVGLLIGDKSNMDLNVKKDFQNANLVHVIAVSGAHFIYVICLLKFILKKIKNKRLLEIFLIIGILMFMRLTLYTPSVVRAGVMAILKIVSSFVKRDDDIYTNLAFSSLILIIINPYSIFDIGAILSFAGVIGIVCFSDVLMNLYKYYDGVFKNMLDLISVTVSANILIIPIIIYYYHSISFTFIVSNIVVAPFLGVLIIIGFITFIFKFKILILLLNFIGLLFIKSVHVLANLPFSNVVVLCGSFLFVVLCYLFVYCICKKKRFVSFIILVCIIFSECNLFFDDKLHISFIDVGQGDCTFINYKNKNILIDSGGGIKENDYDIGKNVLLPYLINRKVRCLDYIMVSHFDADHCRAFLYIMKYIKIKKALISRQVKNSKMYLEFLKIARDRNIDIIYVEENDLINIGELKIEIYNPNDDVVLENFINNNAILCRISFFDFRILFTGDLEKAAEDKIVFRYKDTDFLNSDIIKVGHHGSNTSTTDDFLELVNPKIALIGCGENNNFGHPNQFVLNKLNDKKVKIYRTDLNGEIIISVDKVNNIVIDVMIDCDYSMVLEGKFSKSRLKY